MPICHQRPQSTTTRIIKFCELLLAPSITPLQRTASTMCSDLIVDFPAQARQSGVSSKPKKKKVTFSIMSDIRFYERPDKVHAKELHYSSDDDEIQDGKQAGCPRYAHEAPLIGQWHRSGCSSSVSRMRVDRDRKST